MAGVIGRAFRASSRSHEKRRTGFRVIHFTIQSNHLHLIVEADTRSALLAGLRGLAIWIARRVNQHLGTTGRVFAERYHARALTSARQVRTAIVYVLQNHKRHEPLDRFRVDSRSSGPWFRGWTSPLSLPPTSSPVSEPTTYLAREGWRRLGLIHFDEGPSPKPLF